MRVVALVSGGKDSCFNILQCVAAGHEIVALANLRPESNLRGKFTNRKKIRLDVGRPYCIFLKKIESTNLLVDICYPNLSWVFDTSSKEQVKFVWAWDETEVTDFIYVSVVYFLNPHLFDSVFNSLRIITISIEQQYLPILRMGVLILLST